MLLRCFEGCVLGSLVFFIGSGRSVWHRRSPQVSEVLKKRALELARPEFWEALTVRSQSASQSQVQVQNKARSKPWSGKNCFFFLSVPAAAFDIEDHPSTGLRSKSCSGTNRLFFSGSGRNVWHWRSLQRRSKNGLLQLARPCCFAVLEAAFGALSFLSVPAAAFDIEDHLSTGLRSKSCSGTNRLFFSGSGRSVWHWRSPQHRSKNGVIVSSPGHAVSLFRRQPFWEGFWVRSRGFAGRDTQMQPKVPTVYFEGNWRCKLRPKAAKPSFFIDSGRDVWHWRSPGHAVSLFRRQPFWEGFWVRKTWFCPSWRPNATEGANGVFRRQLEVQIPAAAFDIEDHPRHRSPK